MVSQIQVLQNRDFAKPGFLKSWFYAWQFGKAKLPKRPALPVSGFLDLVLLNRDFVESKFSKPGFCEFLFPVSGFTGFVDSIHGSANLALGFTDRNHGLANLVPGFVDSIHGFTNLTLVFQNRIFSKSWFNAWAIWLPPNGQDIRILHGQNTNVTGT